MNKQDIDFLKIKVSRACVYYQIFKKSHLNSYDDSYALKYAVLQIIFHSTLIIFIPFAARRDDQYLKINCHKWLFSPFLTQRGGTVKYKVLFYIGHI